MNRLLAVGIIELSDGAILAMRRNGINCLQDLMIQRDLRFLTSEHFGGDYIEELLGVCEKIDEFNNGLKREIIPAEVEGFNASREKNELLIKSEQSDGLNVNRRPIDDGRRRTRESIMKDLVSIANLETPTSLRKAMLKLMIDHSDRSFDRKTIKKILEDRYKGTISINSDAIRSNLSTLESHMFIERINSLGYFKITRYALSEFSKLSSAENYFKESKKNRIAERRRTERFY
jgi:Fe2+ or Zn2+ uptake regulation protein